ncbi:kinesin-like protein KIF20A isoform X2 [Phymastichus coffea]|nr:kinesin-like protein KIF20A isoform X2 [Phymastichus coffea]
MNGTLSSENESLRGDMSYLYGRDPSILAYGQRPFPSQESKKNLMLLLQEEKEDNESIESRDKDSTCNDSLIQTIKVFLRMKPFPRKMKLTAEQTDAYSIVNSTTLLTKMPSLDNNTSCLKKIKTSDVVCRKFMFTQTFGPETSQLKLFDEAVKPQLLDFLAGKNSVVMSYGTTNSGKTYTLQGTAESPGIIPRGIEFVFGHLSPRTLPCFKPINHCDVVYLNNNERLQESNEKIKLLAFNSVDKNSHERTYKQMQHLLHEELPMRPNHRQDAQYSVWISFAEIYNETIYDLLWNDCQKKRPALKLVTDNKGRAFIKGLKRICVSSGAEAYQLLMAGQYNLKVAATALNSRSSRSHCIFTIKLLKYTNENDPLSVDVSTFAFCDLAGSERLKKTLNVGERLKEAQNINTSLLVLGRCLKQIYESQASIKQKNDSIGPFRESKLTRLFQRALSGKEQISLIVNVNPVPNLYVETQNVLNFSAIAKKIVIERNQEVIKRKHSHSRFSRLVTQSIKTEMDWENTELDDQTDTSDDQTQESDIDENDQECYEELLTENELLKREIKELKTAAFTRDMQTRQEMSDMYSEMMKKLEAEWKNRMIDMEEQQEDLRELAVEQIELFYKEKLNCLSARKRSRQSDDNENESDDDRKIIEDLEMENTRLVAKIETLKKSVRDLKHSKEEIETEKTKLSFELNVVKDEAKRTNDMLLTAQNTINSGGDVSANYMNELNDIIKKKDDRIKTMKVFLNEAKEEYIFITNQAQKMENQLKARDEALVEHTEHISDLEEQLNQANAYSSEQSKLIENLEEELEQQTKKWIEAEEKIKVLTDKLSTKNTLKSDEVVKAPENESTDQELTNVKALLEELKLRLEFSENENTQLKEQLNGKVDEIESLKNNFDLTKNELDKVTKKVNVLSIEGLADEKVNEMEAQEKKAQTEIFEPLYVKVTETANISCQASQDIVDISCQTLEIVNPSIETDEKGLQTSILLEQNEISNAVKMETPNMEEFNELQKHCEEMKLSLEIKINDEKQFDETIQNLQVQVEQLIIQDQEKTNKIAVLQAELENTLKKSNEEVRDLKILVEAQENRAKNLMDQITEAHVREQDREGEISSFQKEVKNLIQSCEKKEEQIRTLESETKTVLKECTMLKEQLTKSDEKSRKMEKDYRNVIHILEVKVGTLEKKYLEKETENEKLKQSIKDLKRSLDEAEHELIVFTRNRDETVSRYEDLLKVQCEDMENQKKEIAKLHKLFQESKENTIFPTPLKNKKLRTNVREAKKSKAADSDVIENTSDEDQHKENLKLKKEFLTPTKDNVMELSDTASESKSHKSAQSATKGPSKSTKKSRRKLHIEHDEEYIDLEPSEPSPVQPRSLRNRRK